MLVLDMDACFSTIYTDLITTFLFLIIILLELFINLIEVK